MSQSIKFGTDGWRAILDKEFTLPNVERLAQAFADYLCLSPKSSRRVVVGYDFRRGSEDFAMSFTSILLGSCGIVGAS